MDTNTEPQGFNDALMRLTVATDTLFGHIQVSRRDLLLLLDRVHADHAARKVVERSAA